MSALPPAPASGDDRGVWFPEPVTGVFRSSWRAVLKEAAWVAAPVLLIFGVLGWLDGDALFVGIGVLSAAVWTGVSATVYRIWGAESVEITPEALTVTKRGRRPVTVVWAELRDANYRTGQGGNSWVFRHGHERTVVPERGYAFDDWSAVCQGIHDWKASGPLATLPGIEAERQRPGPTAEGVVFKAHQPTALFWGIPFFFIGGLLPLLDGLSEYQDGTWTEDVMVTIGFPLFGFGFVAMGVLGLTRAARRITFGSNELQVDLYLGRQKTIPYSEVLDAWDKTLKTRRGTVMLGDRNVDSFHRLLSERLQDGQLSGDMMYQSLAQLSSIWGLLAVIAVPLPVGFLLAWWFRLPEGSGVLLWLALMVASSIPYTLWARRRARQWKEETERNADPPEATGGSLGRRQRG